MINKKFVSIMCFISIFLMLLNTSTIYSYYFRNISSICLILGSLICIFLFILSINKITFKKELIFIVLFWFICLMIPSIVGGVTDSLFYYFIKFIVLLFDALILTSYRISFSKTLFKCSAVFVVWALANYIIMNTFGSKLPITGTYITSWGSARFLRLFIFFDNYSGINISGFNLIRLHSPFSEPGNAQIYFNFGLLYCLFVNPHNKKNKFLTFLFAIASILTLSFTGYIIFFAIIFLYLIKNKKTFIYIPALVIIIPIIITLATNKLDSMSYSDRSSDLLNTFKNAFDNFPFGVGYGNLNTDVLGERYVDGVLMEANNFSGLFTPMVSLGLFSVTFYYLLFISMKYFKINNRYANLAFTVFLLFSLFTEPQSFSCITITFFINGIINYSDIQSKRKSIQYKKKIKSNLVIQH